MQAVLFDLDGTLLDIDIDAFMGSYLAALSGFCESAFPGVHALAAIMAGTQAMMGSHPTTTNRDVFHEEFERLTGIGVEEQLAAFERFYDGHFRDLRGHAGPRRGALEALAAASDHGLLSVVATNPLFPEVAIRTRLEWANVDVAAVDLVTTYEEFRACKPDPAYYLQIASALEVHPRECMMVGDDLDLDVNGAAAAGMRTFYVGDGDSTKADFSGDMRDVTEAILRTCA